MEFNAGRDTRQGLRGGKVRIPVLPFPSVNWHLCDVP